MCCENNLRQIGTLLRCFRADGTLRAETGAAFLLQVAPQVSDDGRRIFCCPAVHVGAGGNPKPSLRCTYWGPDRESAEAFLRGTRPETAAIACCDLHDDGLRVLLASGRVEKIEGQIGPGSKDTRLRHLVR